MFTDTKIIKLIDSQGNIVTKNDMSFFVIKCNITRHVILHVIYPTLIKVLLEGSIPDDEKNLFRKISRSVGT